MARKKYIIEDWCGNRAFPNKEFKTFDHAFNYILEQFPVIFHEDGTQDDREDELNEYYVAEVKIEEDWDIAAILRN